MSTRSPAIGRLRPIAPSPSLSKHRSSPASLAVANEPSRPFPPTSLLTNGPSRSRSKLRAPTRSFALRLDRRSGRNRSSSFAPRRSRCRARTPSPENQGPLKRRRALLWKNEAPHRSAKVRAPNGPTNHAVARTSRRMSLLHPRSFGARRASTKTTSPWESDHLTPIHACEASQRSYAIFYRTSRLTSGATKRRAAPSSQRGCRAPCS